MERTRPVGPKKRAEKRGLNTKVDLAVDTHGIPVRVRIATGTSVDCIEAYPLIQRIQAQSLLAGRAKDTNEIREHCRQQKIEKVIPSKCNRQEPRELDHELYKLRLLVENALMKIKRWRGIATS